MKRSKKSMIALLLFMAITLSLSLSANAGDPISSKITEVQDRVADISNIDEQILAQVGDSAITNIDVLKYQAYSEIQIDTVALNGVSSSIPSEDDILKELLTEELFLQLAKERGVDATLEEGRKEAQKNREILEAQPQQIRDIQEKLIKGIGVSEEEYWTEIAPEEYQKFISAQNLTTLLVEEGALKFNEADVNAFATELKEFKRDLYENYRLN